MRVGAVLTGCLAGGQACPGGVMALFEVSECQECQERQGQRVWGQSVVKVSSVDQVR